MAKMEENQQQELNKLIEEIRAQQASIEEGQKQGLSAKKVLELQGGLSTFIGTKVGELSAQGISISRIQEVIRAAMDRVPNTYAPDAPPQDDFEDDEEGTDIDPEDLPDLAITTIFKAVKKTVIADFEEGRIDEKNLIDLLTRDACVFNNTIEAIGLVLGNYREESDFDPVTDGGEILTGPDGKAFVPEWFVWRNENGSSASFSDPLVYKNSEEIESICDLIRDIDRKKFLKRFNIKKLFKAEAFLLKSKKELVREKNSIAETLWNDFERLRAFYESAAQDGLWVTMIVLASMGNEK
jgi:hypothetical protein